MATAEQRWFRFRELHKHFARAIERFLEDDMLTYAAAIAYQMFFSLFAFIILVALFGFLQIPGFFDRLVDQAQTVLQRPQAALVAQAGQSRSHYPAASQASRWHYAPDLGSGPEERQAAYHAGLPADGGRYIVAGLDQADCVNVRVAGWGVLARGRKGERATLVEARPLFRLLSTRLPRLNDLLVLRYNY